jgi:hypothetical protein
VREPVQADTLAALAAQDDLASIEYVVASREVSAVGSAPCDLIVSVVPGPARIQVQLMKRPSLLYLESNHPRFADLMRALLEAKSRKKEVNIGVLPGSASIEDVRPN